MGLTLCKMPTRTEEWIAVPMASWDKRTSFPSGVVEAYKKLLNMQQNHQLCYVKMPAEWLNHFAEGEYLYSERRGDKVYVYGAS